MKIPANKFEGSIFERLHKLKDEGKATPTDDKEQSTSASSASGDDDDDAGTGDENEDEVKKLMKIQVDFKKLAAGMTSNYNFAALKDCFVEDLEAKEEAAKKK